MKELHPMRRRSAQALVEDAGARVVATTPEPMAGPRWVSYLYVVEAA